MKLMQEREDENAVDLNELCITDADFFANLELRDDKPKFKSFALNMSDAET